MFGAAARGRMGREGDIDLPVVESGANHLGLAQRMYANFHEVGEGG